MSKTIIAGVDGGAPAHEAAEAAARLAHAFGGKLHVVAVYDTAPDRNARESGFDPSLAAERIAADAAARLAASHPGLEVVPSAQPGPRAAETLVKLAGSLEADMIVVGNKRAKGLGRLLGSIASEVAAKAPCDVYIAHTHD
ncbi:universal stress protein [Nocardioides yefusunii]|uniref:Universal stress protein n=1 Tax=Nocardioides yefusunii TaxID=2500546 RepID=A0ABW1QT50_9ACTN|nr:universal stress protein [Nocardioides yefusunii]